MTGALVPRTPSGLNILDYDDGLVKEDYDVELSRRELLEFTKYTKKNYIVNWHHRALCEKLEKFARGEIKRLMVFMPPRHGKSELVSRRLPAYIFGINPDAHIIACSYGSSLAARMNRDVQRIMDSPEYQEIFPETKLNSKNIRSLATGSALRNSDIFEIVDHDGVYSCAGVGGPIVGMGAHFAIIDDPFKNVEEAESPTHREKVWEWYTTTFYTRLEEEASVLITMTRWNEDDVAGRLIDQMLNEPDADQWEIVCFPATCIDFDNQDDPREIGEALWPSKYNERRLATIKVTLGSRFFGALYQQSPSPDEGDVVHRDWWKFWKVLPEKWDYKITSWDFTFKDAKTSSYVVGQAWIRKGARKYLIDQVREKTSFTGSLSMMRTFCAKHSDANEHVVEEKGNGAAIIDSVKEEIAGVTSYNPDKSKEARANAVSVAPQIEAGNVYLPDPIVADVGPWVNDYIEEWQHFPNGKYDDQVDCTSQALIKIGKGQSILDILDEIDRQEQAEVSSQATGVESMIWPEEMKKKGDTNEDNG